MDPFYIISGLVALALFVLIARNLDQLDREERRNQPRDEPHDEPHSEMTSPPPQPPSPPSAPPPDVLLDMDLDDQLSPPHSPIIPPSAGAVPPPPAVPQSTPSVQRERTETSFDRLETAKETAEEIAEEMVYPAPIILPPVVAPESTQPVEFSAYYPKEVAPAIWHPMVAYVFRPSAADAVEDDAARQLGSRLDNARVIGEPARAPLTEGATITATPHLEGFQFNPPSVTIGFYEDWHRFEFKVRADTAAPDQAVNGVLTFTVEGVIVADLPVSIFVGVNNATGPTASVRAKPYSAVFCSYSRQDLPVVERVERAYRALGMDYLRDMMSLRSGEAWNPALAALIERADIFQLFWSEASAASDHVQMEWEHALQLKDKGDRFIRPVYWNEPAPPVPNALRHLHFAYEPHLAH